MKEECAAPATDSPPARPSTWQLRFGKKSAPRLHPQQNDSKLEVDIRPNHGNQARSPSISEQLLRALDAKPKEQEELSRECVDVLIGRRNAFANGPELRLRTLRKGSESEGAGEQDEYDHEDVATEAKEILRVRFQIETQADTLRHTPGHRKPPKQRSEVKRPPRIRSSTGTATPSNVTYDSSARLSHTTPWRQEKKESRVRLMQSESDNQKTEVRPTKNEPQLAQPKIKQRRQDATSTGTAISSTKSRSRQLPPRLLPMERRQQLLQQAREARKMKAAEEHAMRKIFDPASSDNNKEETREQRRVEEQIERLTLENQHAAALEERLQRRKARLKSLSKVFNGWHQCVEYKREQEVRVAAEFNWRVMKGIIATWKRYTYRQRQVMAAEQARLKLAQEQQSNEQAKQFYRLKCLPSWFYRWATFVTQQKEHRAAEEAAERRRTQTERLMERLQRQKTPTEESQHDSDDQAQSEDTLDTGEKEFPQEITIENAPRRNRQRPIWSSTSTSVRNRQHNQRRQNAWQSAEEYQAAAPDSNGRASVTESPIRISPPPQVSGATVTRAPKRVDKVYEAMEQRAVERKQRREELKRRYEELEQKKREEQEDQRVAREAQLLQQRMEEKERIQERKLTEALALQEKQERRDHVFAQRHKANKHNRRRLLFYYALLPWRKHHALNERVARNARRWHELREVYSHWERWQEFVQICRKLRRRRERAQLEEAARHHDRSLQRRALCGLMRYHQATEARALAVRRQNQWNALQLSWTHWYKRLADGRSYQRKVVLKAAAKLQQAKLLRICAQWRKVTCESKLQQELEREKQQLWRKVRGWLDEDA